MVSPKALTTLPKKAAPTGTPAFFFTDILDHALDSVFKYNDLSIHGMINTIYNGNAIAYPDHRTSLINLSCMSVIVFDLALDNGDDLLRTDCTPSNNSYLPAV